MSLSVNFSFLFPFEMLDKKNDTKRNYGPMGWQREASSDWDKIEVSFTSNPFFLIKYQSVVLACFRCV